MLSSHIYGTNHVAIGSVFQWYFFGWGDKGVCAKQRQHTYGVKLRGDTGVGDTVYVHVHLQVCGQPGVWDTLDIKDKTITFNVFTSGWLWSITSTAITTFSLAWTTRLLSPTWCSISPPLMCAPRRVLTVYFLQEKCDGSPWRQHDSQMAATARQ